MKLKNLVPAVTLGALLIAGCGQEESVKLENHIDQASYGVGLNIGRQLSREEVEMNPEAIAAGIKDALAEKEPRIEDSVIEAAFTKIREEQLRKQEELDAAAAKASEEFLAENAGREGVKTTESGLQYEIITEKEGDQPKPAETDTVRVHYHGTLIDGTVFDSSVERGEPAQFPVNGVIKGWIEALQMMQVGDKWKLHIPAELAYGARSPSPKIPANSALVFEVELLEIVKPDTEAEAAASAE